MNCLVIMGMPAGHWCETSERMMNARVPQVNETIARARRAGWMVAFGANRVVAWENGNKPYPRGRRVPAIEKWKEQPDGGLVIPQWPKESGCVCPTPKCEVQEAPLAHFHPDLDIRYEDYCIGSHSAMYTLIKRHNLTQLYYGGAHTDMCLLTAPGGMAWMREIVSCAFIAEASISHRLDEEDTNRVISAQVAPQVRLDDVLPKE